MNTDHAENAQFPPTSEALDIVHIYAQTHWHSPAVISGSRAGLTRLHDAIDHAIATGSGVAEVMADDGECYHVAVLCEGPHEHAEWTAESGDRGLPYSDEMAASPPERSFWERVQDVIRKA